MAVHYHVLTECFQQRSLAKAWGARLRLTQNVPQHVPDRLATKRTMTTAAIGNGSGICRRNVSGSGICNISDNVICSGIISIGGSDISSNHRRQQQRQGQRQWQRQHQREQPQRHPQQSAAATAAAVAAAISSKSSSSGSSRCSCSSRSSINCSNISRSSSNRRTSSASTAAASGSKHQAAGINRNNTNSNPVALCCFPELAH